jgi:phosphoadenosine phosphosulfate reductase
VSAVTLYARATPGFDERVAGAAERVREAANRHAGSIVQASSLGAEDMVVSDLLATHAPSVAIATLQTGMLHEETLGLIDQLEARYGVVVERYQPVTEAAIQFVRRHGGDAMFRSIDLRKACCGLRKMEPLSRLLAGRSAWITGLRREQSATRGEVGFVERDEAGRSKLNPLADWSWNDVWHYIALHSVPYNPLHDRFYPSIGCAPCTRAVAVGEEFRAGRWWWEIDAAKECGLHVAHEGTSPRSNARPCSFPAGRIRVSCCAWRRKRSSATASMPAPAIRIRSPAGCPSRCCTSTPATTFRR